MIIILNPASTTESRVCAHRLVEVDEVAYIPLPELIVVVRFLDAGVVAGERVRVAELVL